MALFTNPAIPCEKEVTGGAVVEEGFPGSLVTYLAALVVNGAGS